MIKFDRCRLLVNILFLQSISIFWYWIQERVTPVPLKNFYHLLQKCITSPLSKLYKASGPVWQLFPGGINHCSTSLKGNSVRLEILTISKTHIIIISYQHFIFLYFIQLQFSLTVNNIDMPQKHPKTSMPGMIILILILLNAVIMKSAYINNAGFHWALIITFPILIFALNSHHKNLEWNAISFTASKTDNVWYIILPWVQRNSTIFWNAWHQSYVHLTQKSKNVYYLIFSKFLRG